jgi:hypothetical protein
MNMNAILPSNVFVNYDKYTLTFYIARMTFSSII